MKKQITVPIAWIEKMVKLKNEVAMSPANFIHSDALSKINQLIGYLESLEEMAKE
jgi:hypothetical protein